MTGRNVKKTGMACQ